MNVKSQYFNLKVIKHVNFTVPNQLGLSSAYTFAEMSCLVCLAACTQSCVSTHATVKKIILIKFPLANYLVNMAPLLIWLEINLLRYWKFEYLANRNSSLWRFHVGFFERSEKWPSSELDSWKSHLERLEIWKGTIIFFLISGTLTSADLNVCKEK
jgi:hypothetical protein